MGGTEKTKSAPCAPFLAHFVFPRGNICPASLMISKEVSGSLHQPQTLYLPYFSFNSENNELSWSCASNKFGLEVVLAGISMQHFPLFYFLQVCPELLLKTKTSPPG